MLVTPEKPKWVHQWLMYFRDSCGWVHGDLVKCHSSEDLNKPWKSQICHLLFCNWSNWLQGLSSLGIVVRKRQALTWKDRIPMCSYTAFMAVSLTLRNSHLRNCLVIMIHFSLVMLSSFHLIPFQSFLFIYFNFIPGLWCYGEAGRNTRNASYLWSGWSTQH